MDAVLSGEYATSFFGLTRPRKHITILNWNINRGLNLASVMDFVSLRSPDLCILQEVDLNAKRTGKIDVADVLASRLRFNYVFGVEFEELSQGSHTDRAYQGQAVLARWRIEQARVLRFQQQSDVWRPRWFLPRWPAFQPRRGGRMALVTELAIGRTKLVVYDVHLESQGHDDLRLSQLTEIVHDSNRYSPDTPIVVAGDLNTRDAPSPLQQYLLASGFQDACDSRSCRATKPTGETRDWIFTRGPVLCSGTTVHHNVSASDHFPVSTKLTVNV